MVKPSTSSENVSVVEVTDAGSGHTGSSTFDAIQMVLRDRGPKRQVKTESAVGGETTSPHEQTEKWDNETVASKLKAQLDTMKEKFAVLNADIEKKQTEYNAALTGREELWNMMREEEEFQQPIKANLEEITGISLFGPNKDATQENVGRLNKILQTAESIEAAKIMYDKTEGLKESKRAKKAAKVKKLATEILQPIQKEEERLQQMKAKLEAITDISFIGQGNKAVEHILDELKRETRATRKRDEKIQKSTDIGEEEKIESGKDALQAVTVIRLAAEILRSQKKEIAIPQEKRAELEAITGRSLVGQDNKDNKAIQETLGQLISKALAIEERYERIRGPVGPEVKQLVTDIVLSMKKMEDLQQKKAVLPEIKLTLDNLKQRRDELSKTIRDTEDEINDLCDSKEEEMKSNIDPQETVVTKLKTELGYANNRLEDIQKKITGYHRKEADLRRQIGSKKDQERLLLQGYREEFS